MITTINEFRKINESDDKLTYNVLSPDGITITPEDYPSKNDAYNAMIIWGNRFVKQGYYSSNNGKISMDELTSYCRMVTYKNGEEIEKYYL